MDKIEEIKAAISTFQNDEVFRQVKLRYEKDFDLWRSKPYDAGSGYYSYTTNSPKNLASKAISMLTEAKLLIRIPEEELKKDEREKANNVERFLYGALTINDERLGKIPNMPALRNQMAWYSVVRGGFAERVLVYKGEDKKTHAPIDAWDLYNTAYGVGENGVLWAAHIRMATKEQIKAEYDIETTSATTKIIDFYDMKKRGVIVGDEWGIKLVEHGLDYCPVFIIQSGDIPPVAQDNYNYTAAHIGDSIFSANRDIYPVMNKTVSDLLTIVRRGVKVPIGVWSASGETTIDKDIWQVDKAGVVPFTSDVVVKPLLEPAMPADSANLLNFISGEEQRGGISHVAQGELGFRLSGFAINQLQASLSTMIVPFADSIKRAYSLACLSLLDQYSKGAFEPMEVRGRTSKNQPFGVPKAITIAPSDIDGTWHPEVELEPILPKDDAQRYTLAQLATTGDRPLLSVDTARESLLGLADTDLEAQKVDRQFADSLPIKRLYAAFTAALADGREDDAFIFVSELKRLLASRQGGTGGGQTTRAPTSIEELAAGSPGTGIPSGQTGLPTQVMPPEAMGGMPPGAQNAGAPPPQGGVI